MRRLLGRLVLAMFVGAAPGRLVAQRSASGRAPASDAITTPKMRADLEFLASDALRGRLTDTPENAIALEWVAARFKWLGLAPMGANGTYFQTYNLSLGALGTGPNEMSVASGDQVVRHDSATGFYPLRFSASGTATGAVVFAHFGISAPALGYDDLGDDVRGKVLLVLDHEPGENDSTSVFDGVVTSASSSAMIASGAT
mgnify:CR=1 FL=1